MQIIILNNNLHLDMLWYNTLHTVESSFKISFEQ